MTTNDTEISTDLAAARDERDLLEGRLIAAIDRIKELEISLAQCHIDLATTTSERDSARSRYEEALARNSELAAERTTLQDKLTLANAEITRLADELNRTTHDHRSFIDQLVSDAHTEAEERDWCADFDDWMAEHGLPRRTIVRQFYFDVEFRYRTHWIRINGLAVEDTGDGDYEEAYQRSSSPESLAQALAATFGFDTDEIAELRLV